MKSSLTLPIFVVTTNAHYGEQLAYHLSQNPDYKVKRFVSLAACLAHSDEAPEVITLNLSAAEGSGEHTVQELLTRWPQTSLIIISEQADVRTAVSLLQQGAYDYLVKAADTTERLWQIVGHVAHKVRLRHENERLRQQISARYGPQQTILGQHPSIKHLQALISKAAAATITVSISGETGTGKELVAKAIHFGSKRAGRPFVAVNMPAIPRELLESELFGHEKGSFTGAVSRRIGRFEEANGGSIFLDEVADLDLSLQAKLLRVLQEREVSRLGSNQRVAFDVRLIAATNRNLAHEVEAGRFREDLYYRLLGLPIELPPLRERGNDVLLLAEAFLRDFCLHNNLPLRRLSACAQQRLLAHPFPGNVRELKAVVELGAVLAEGDLIQPEDLTLRTYATAVAAHTSPVGSSLRDQTIAIIQRCLDEMNGDVVAAAGRLQIGKSTIYRMLQHQDVRLH